MSADGIQHSPLLVGLTDEEVGRLLAVAERRSYADSDILVEENTPSDCLFILTGGSVQVERRHSGGVVPLARLAEAGEFFGEMSLIDIMPRSADIRALGATEVLAFPKKSLTTVFTEAPRVQMTLILNISRILSLRLREADERIVELSRQG